MPPDFRAFDVLKRHGVPFVIIGGHAVNFHGHPRATDDADVVWVRSAEAETALLAALTELDAKYIGKDIDPATGIERAYPVDRVYLSVTHLLMLWTRFGFLDRRAWVERLSRGVERPAIRLTRMAPTTQTVGRASQGLGGP